MIIRKTDSLNDFTFGKGLNNYAVDLDAINQNIKSRILSWKGDCFFSPDDFVDWKGRLDVGQQDNLLQEVKLVILQSYGVVGITKLTGVYTSSTRLYTITYEIDTIFGQSFQSQITQNLGGTI